MTGVRCDKIILVVLLAIVCICLIPKTADAEAIKTSISEILSNQDKYDGKMVKVEGKVEALKSRTSERGNPYTTFTIRDYSGGSLNVITFGTLHIRNGSPVVVIGRYQKVKRVLGLAFYSEIDATDGSVRKIGN